MILGYGGRSRRADGRKHADIGWSGDIEYRQGRRYRSTFGHLRARDAEIALQFWEKLGIIVYNEERSSVRFAKAEYVELCGMNKTKLRAHARDKGLSSEGSKKTILDRVVRHSRGEIVQGRAHASPRDRSFIKSSLNEAQKLVKTVSEKKRADGKHKSRFLGKWHACVAKARKELGLAPNAKFTKGTPLYKMATELMAAHT